MQVISFTAQFDRWAQDLYIFFGLTLDRTFCKILALNVNNERRNQCQFKSTWEEIYLSVNTLVINFLHSNQKRPLLSFSKSTLSAHLPNTKFSIMECMLFQIDHRDFLHSLLSSPIVFVSDILTLYLRQEKMGVSLISEDHAWQAYHESGSGPAPPVHFGLLSHVIFVSNRVPSRQRTPRILPPRPPTGQG